MRVTTGLWDIWLSVVSAFEEIHGLILNIWFKNLLETYKKTVILNYYILSDQSTLFCSLVENYLFDESQGRPNFLHLMVIIIFVQTFYSRWN